MKKEIIRLGPATSLLSAAESRCSGPCCHWVLMGKTIFRNLEAPGPRGVPQAVTQPACDRADNGALQLCPVESVRLGGLLGAGQGSQLWRDWAFCWAAPGPTAGSGAGSQAGGLSANTEGLRPQARLTSVAMSPLCLGGVRRTTLAFLDWHRN